MPRAAEQDTVWLAHCYQLAKYFENSGKWMAMNPSENEKQDLQRWLWMRLWKASHVDEPGIEKPAH